MSARTIAVAACLASAAFARAQAPIRYTLRVDPKDLTSVMVAMTVPAVTDTLRLAMATHDEYADRWWRYVRDVSATGVPRAAILREDSAVWRITGAQGEVVVSYRVMIPPDSVAGPWRAWVPHLSATGGLVGGIDCFFYVMGRAASPALVTFELPDGWRVAGGLEATSDPNVFRAADAATLLDSPMLVGALREWRTPGARVAFLPSSATVAFDSAAFLASLDRIVRQTLGIFGAAPYREYTFLFIEGAVATLEHSNSLVLGISSAQLAKDPDYYVTELSHEFVHTWNLIRLHPVGLRAIHPGPTPRVAELWWSEGMTIFFADEVLLRAGLYPAGATRATRLASRIGRYLANPGYTHVSPERASETVGLPPPITGDYSGDYYLSGQLVGDLLELAIRDSTDGARGMDDVIRALYRARAGEPGYTFDDIAHAADSVCGCRLRPFLERHVRRAEPIEFDGALASIGYRARITWDTARDQSGAPIADARVFVMRPDGAPPSSPLIIGVTRPTGAWAAAGLHSGDQLIAIDGQNVASWDRFRSILRGVRVGDTLVVTYARDGHRHDTRVLMDVYAVPTVTLVPLDDATPRQLARRAQWLAGE